MIHLPRATGVLLLLLLTGAALGSYPQAGSAQPAASSTCGEHSRLIGWSDTLDGTTFNGFEVGGLSALNWDSRTGTFLALLDNQGSNPARYYTLTIPVDTDTLGTPIVTAVTTLQGENGPLTGETSDNEGMALLPDGSLLVSSEVEPSIRHFSRAGTPLGELPVPEQFRIEPTGGGVLNGTFESLALSPSGHRLFTANEEPLSGDSRASDGRGRHRILRYGATDTAAAFEPMAEYLYETEPEQAVVEIIALTETRLLVLERSFSLGLGSTIRLFETSIAGAMDISAIANLSDAQAVPLEKRLLLDLADCPANGAPNPGLQINPLLDNIEAMTLGPRQPNGSRPLMLVSDNNFNEFQATRVYALTLDLLAGRASPGGPRRWL